MVTLKEIMDKNGRTPEKLLQILLDLQENSNTNCLTEEDIKNVAAELDMPNSKVYEVATFYNMFHLGEKRGKYLIEVCKSAPCHVCGCKAVVNMLQTDLGIKVGQSTPDGRFTLITSSCFGGCDVGPAIKIGEKVYGNLDSLRLKEILATYKEVGLNE